MRGPTQKLNELKIGSKLKEARQRIADGTAKASLLGDGGGLTLQISKTGTASWIFRYMRVGKPTAVGLGPYPAVSLKAARAAAEKHREVLANGQDPKATKHAEDTSHVLPKPAAKIFDESVAEYLADHTPSWKSAKHADQWASTLRTYASPVIGRLPLADISVQHIKTILDPIWTTKRETASRVRGRIEAVLDRANALGERQGENPARWKTLRFLLAASTAASRSQKHHAALPYAQMPVFMEKLANQEGMTRWALEFLVLTAARTSEVTGAEVSEFDLDRKIWTIPAARMKAGKSHRVPLVEQAVQIVQTVLPFSDGKYVFPGAKTDRPLSQMACLMLMRRMGYGEFTVHGFRSAFSTAMSETTEHAERVIEEALAHKLRDKVAAAYSRGDLIEKRLPLMRDWAALCYGNLSKI